MPINDHAGIEPWLSQIDWELRYDTPSASQVIDKMIELGFRIINPPMPPYAVTYNGVPVFRCYMREEAERFISDLDYKPGYSIKEETP